MIIGYSFYSLCHFFRMVYQQLPVVHFRENFNVYVGVQFFQMLHLRLGNESLQGSVPVMDISPGMSISVGTPSLPNNLKSISQSIKLTTANKITK